MGEMTGSTHKGSGVAGMGQPIVGVPSTGKVGEGMSVAVVVAVAVLVGVSVLVGGTSVADGTIATTVGVDAAAPPCIELNSDTRRMKAMMRITTKMSAVVRANPSGTLTF